MLNILNYMISIKRNLCLWSIYEYNTNAIKFITNILKINQDILDTIPGSQSISASYTWPGTILDQTPQVIWMLYEFISFTEFRRHYYSVCDYYGPCADECNINIYINMRDASMYAITVNMPTGLVNITSNNNRTSDSVVFNILDVSRYINKVSGTDLSYESLGLSKLDNP